MVKSVSTIPMPVIDGVTAMLKLKLKIFLLPSLRTQKELWFVAQTGEEPRCSASPDDHARKSNRHLAPAPLERSQGAIIPPQCITAVFRLRHVSRWPLTR